MPIRFCSSSEKSRSVTRDILSLSPVNSPILSPRTRAWARCYGGQGAPRYLSLRQTPILLDTLASLIVFRCHVLESERTRGWCYWPDRAGYRPARESDVSHVADGRGSSLAPVGRFYSKRCGGVSRRHKNAAPESCV